jgi:uncharacterized protein YggE
VAEPNTPVLSVRGEARQTVAPDSVFLPGALTVTARSKPDALRAAAAALESLTADLRSLGGAPLRPETERNPLTWSAFSASTHAEGNHDPRTGSYELTGRVTATVAVITTIRDFALLDRLSALLARHESLAIHHAGWNVDADNPAWPEVRAAAINSAIRKGRDYAAALGGSLLEVLHIADVGLLGGESGDAGMRRMGGSAYFPAAAMATAGGPAPDAPSLDPVPQELTATIEARFTTAGISLVAD